MGAGVVEALQTNGNLIARRIGVKPVIRQIADLDLDTDRGVAVDPAILTRDAKAVLHNPAVHVVVETIGGTTVAKTLVLEALRLGKPVVTANKAMLADHGEEIFKTAARGGADVSFEASVGGGIPIIRALREGLVANRVLGIYGIVNGTCNYILSRMTDENAPFDVVLKDAQAAGFAEANPSLDIDGVDTAHKAVVLASLAYGFQVPMRSVFVEGIRGIARTDIEYARSLGYKLKLLAVLKNEGADVEVRVHPTLVPMEHMLAQVGGSYNAIFVEGDIVGQTMFYGRGAGRRPTASAVVSDIAEVCRTLASKPSGEPRPQAFAWNSRPVRIRKIGEIEARYYLRLSLPDRAGMLGKLATVLGQHGISIASVFQKEKHAGQYVPVVIVTHRAREQHMSTALRSIHKASLVGGIPICIRIEDLGIEK